MYKKVHLYSLIQKNAFLLYIYTRCIDKFIHPKKVKITDNLERLIIYNDESKHH